MSPTARERLDRATSEDQLLTLVLELAAISGWMAYHVRRSDKALTIGKGYPDVTLAGHGHVMFVELKTERGQLEPEQERWRDQLLGAGADWRLWRPSMWRTIELVLTSAEPPGPTARELDKG